MCIFILKISFTVSKIIIILWIDEPKKYLSHPCELLISHIY